MVWLTCQTVLAWGISTYLLIWCHTGVVWKKNGSVTQRLTLSKWQCGLLAAVFNWRGWLSQLERRDKCLLDIPASSCCLTRVIKIMTKHHHPGHHSLDTNTPPPNPQTHTPPPPLYCNTTLWNGHLIFIFWCVEVVKAVRYQLPDILNALEYFSIENKDPKRASSSLSLYQKLK